MKQILILLITMFSLQGFSQEWADIGALWHYTKSTIDPDLTSYTTFESVSDTIINGMPCKHLIQVDRAYDTTAVYSHYMYSSNDSVFFFRDDDFHLLLNFNAVEGDTIVLGWYATANGDPLLMIVDSTSTIDINGESRKIQYVDCGDGLVVEYADEVIEGIGSTYYMFPVLDGQPYGALRCYEDNVIGQFMSPFHPNHGWNFEDCNQIITGITELESANRISVYPNPFTTSTSIEFILDGKSKIQISIYNTFGQPVYHFEDHFEQGNHKVTWSPGHIPRGMYYAVLNSEEGVRVVKMVKQ